ncbi:MAG TPA: hypothetical protein VGX25_06795 [Actinophytocola sp.]|uniref:hypothetical protein n=1 Tax=Actinophytocola sp. TaxID=1872138 RepID=UPI002DDD17DE|nr:hypothetical protein [Actinophytocola sp.]HEV2779096.1 hypothetical protein [Actinophytocola sp.]
MTDCPMELCPHWAGDGNVCPCAVFDLPRPVVAALTRPPLTLSHLTQCDGRDHLLPIGDEPGEEFEYHGESLNPAAINEQCMCGHLPYYTCPDYLGVHNLTEMCKTGQHERCDRRAEVEYTGEVQDEACPCDCHAIPGPEPHRAEVSR